MYNATNVLIYGKDVRLLDTRRLVLERSGYRVGVASTLSEVMDAEGPMELFIFCHTVSMQECGRAIAVCQARWPRAKCLFMSAGDMQCATSGSSEVLDSMEGPEKLVSTVGRIVERGNVVPAYL